MSHSSSNEVTNNLKLTFVFIFSTSNLLSEENSGTFDSRPESLKCFTTNLCRFDYSVISPEALITIVSLVAPLWEPFSSILSITSSPSNCKR